MIYQKINNPNAMSKTSSILWNSCLFRKRVMVVCMRFILIKKFKGDRNVVIKNWYGQEPGDNRTPALGDLTLSPATNLSLWIGIHQRVLNGLYRIRLSCRRMIWLLTHPLLLLPYVYCIARPTAHRKTVKERQLADGRGGRSQIIWKRKRLVL